MTEVERHIGLGFDPRHLHHHTAALVQQIVSSTLTGGSTGENMTTEELLWILIGINSVSFLYFNWRLALHSTVVKNMVKEQPNLKNKPKRK